MFTHYCPLPYPDETLYSVEARSILHQNLTSKEFLVRVLGSRNAVVNKAVPNRISKLLANTVLGEYYSAEEIIRKCTLLNFYTVHLSERKRQELLSKCIEDPKGKKYVLSEKWKMDQSLKFCSGCVKDDTQEKGEPYWHLSHQIPGVQICIKHGTFLKTNCSTCATDFSCSKHAFIALTKACKNNHDLSGESYSVTDDCRENIAGYVEDTILLNNYSQSLDPRQVQYRYFEKLKDHGFISRNGSVLISSLWEAIIDYFGKWVTHIYSPNDTDSCKYLGEYFYKNVSGLFPAYHVLITRFLFGSMSLYLESDPYREPFGQAPWPCLNFASDHYLSLLADVNITQYQGHPGKLHGKFVCQTCDFTYERAGPDKTYSDRFKFDRVLKVGNDWPQELISILSRTDSKANNLLECHKTLISQYLLQLSRQCSFSRRFPEV